MILLHRQIAVAARESEAAEIQANKRRAFSIADFLRNCQRLILTPRRRWVISALFGNHAEIDEADTDTVTVTQLLRERKGFFDIREGEVVLFLIPRHDAETIQAAGNSFAVVELLIERQTC